MNKTKIAVKGGKLEGLLQGLASLNGIDIADSVQILNVAENINAVRAQMDGITATLEKIAADVSSRSVLAGPGGAQEPPQAEFNRKRADVMSRSYDIELWTLPVELLLDGPKKASPGAVAELMPILRNVDRVRLPEN